MQKLFCASEAYDQSICQMQPRAALFRRLVALAAYPDQSHTWLGSHTQASMSMKAHVMPSQLHVTSGVRGSCVHAA